MIKEFKENIALCLSLSQHDMITRPEWGDVTFGQLSGQLNVLFSSCRDLQSCSLEILPLTLVSRANGILLPTIESLRRIDSFEVGADVKAARADRDEITDATAAQIARFTRLMGPWIPYLLHHKLRAAERITALEDAIASGEKKLSEIDKISADAKKATGAIGTDRFTAKFQEESRANSREAAIWISFASLFLACIFVFALFYVDDFVNIARDTKQMVVFIFKSVAVVGTLLTAALWCGRNYRVLKTQSLVHRHRALSLQTYEAFVSAARSEETKDEVLLAATRTVFTHYSTGYPSQGKDIPD